MSANIDAIISKVQKLLALAQSSNEHEAAAAAAKAQEILQTYNLELSQVAAKGGQGDTTKREKTLHDRAAMYKYQQVLMQSIAKNNFCRAFIQEEYIIDPRKVRRRAKRHYLIGSKLNVTVAGQMYDYLVSRMDQLLPYQGMEKRGKNALLWLDGCTSRLVSRLERQRAEREAEGARAATETAASRHPAYAAEPGTGLVLATVYANEDDLNEDALQGLEPGTTSRRKAERKAWEEKARAEWAELKRLRLAAHPEATDEEKAWLIHGYTLEAARELIRKSAEDEAKLQAKIAKGETPRQRRIREEREERWQEEYEARRRKEQAKYNTEAYQLGAQAGEKIGLNEQVEAEAKGALK